jgi:hypothetical protein
MSRVLCVSMSLAFGLLVASVYGSNQVNTNEIAAPDSLEVCLGGCGNQSGAQIACATGGQIAPCPDAATCLQNGNVCWIVTTSSSQTCNNPTENFDCTLTCGGNCAKVYYGTLSLQTGCSTCPSPGSGCGAAACTSNTSKCS